MWPVPPLELPDPAASPDPAVLGQFSAVQLFVARARASMPGFGLDEDNAGDVAALCRRLDGIPLALELAATRVRNLGVRELLARMDDRFGLLITGPRDAPARQRTLQGVIDWSWDLLTEPERLVLRRLAVTADGFSLHAAEAICAEAHLDVLDLVARLADRSLVVVADGPEGHRYRLLETVAAYGLQRLRQAGESGRLRLRHRLFYTDLAERAAPRLRAHDQRTWLGRLDTETANLRGSLASAIEDDDAGTALRMVNALAWYWFLRGDLAGVHRDARQSLVVFRELGDRWGQLQATEWLGALAAATGDYGQASRLHRDGLRMAEDLSLWPQAADALSWLGRSALRSGDLPQAREFLERAMRLAAEQSYQPGQVFAELGLGLTARREGTLDVAESHLRNVLRSSRRPGAEPDIARMISRSELGFIAEQRGDPATAQTSHLECLAVARALGDPQAVAQALTGLAGAQALAGQPGRAAQLLRAADALRRPAAPGLPPDETDDARRITAATRRALGEAAFAAEFGTGRQLGPEGALFLVSAVNGALARPGSGPAAS